jgi:hypothetical protein
MLSGLGRLRNELIKAATDTTVDKGRRQVALDIIEEIDNSQTEGYQPKTTPADGWLGEGLPLQTQMEIWLLVTLENRWAQDKPPCKRGHERVVSMSSVTPDTASEFEEIF